jgi:hypothetical protein
LKKKKSSILNTCQICIIFSFGHSRHSLNYIRLDWTLDINTNNVEYVTVLCSIKKNSIQLECVSKAYIKDLMYLKRNTKFVPDRWGLKTPPASQSSLNEIVFRSHERSVKSIRNWIFQKMVKVNYAFFPQKWKNLIVMTIWSYFSQ